MAEPLIGVRILVVDDHSDSRDVLDQALRFMGAIVTTVDSADGAMKALADVDIVVTDLAMPGKDGVWLCEQITTSLRPIPVVLLSGFAESQRPAVAQAPFALKLLKPVDPWDLARELLTVLNSR